jgi:HEAT repeat protein
VRKLFAEIDKIHGELDPRQLESLNAFTRKAAQCPDSDLSKIQLEEITKRLSDPAITLAQFKLLAGQVELLYHIHLEQGEYDQASKLLELIDQKANEEIRYESGLAEYAAELVRGLTTARSAELLISRLARDFAGTHRLIVPIIERFSSVEAILVFSGYLSHPNRDLRVTLIRILSQFGEETIRSFRILLSDRTMTQRPPGQSDLPLESWYRLRNVIHILGNIQHPDSIALLEPFSRDTDDRVLEELLIALEKLKGTKSAEIAARLLFHPRREIQSRALQVLSQIGTPAEYPAVEHHFVKFLMERPRTFPLLIRLDKNRAFHFLSQVLEGKSEIYNKYHPKPDEELNEMIVRAFIQLRVPVLDESLDRYVRNSRRSLIGYLRKSASVKLAEKYLRVNANSA